MSTPRIAKKDAVREEVIVAESLWGKMPPLLTAALAKLLKSYRFSIISGDLTLLGNRWYVTHSGLLRLSCRNHCTGIDVRPLYAFCDASARRWAFKATVYIAKSSPGFVGYGDADPSNVSDLVHGAELRIAETRAVNRALRKAYGIGICSVEELGSSQRMATHERPVRKLPPEATNGQGGDGNGARVRDRLCQLIRQHKLDAELVKAYAIDFCGTKALRDATREQVESFVRHLADWAEKDRNALLCQLNSYQRRQVQPEQPQAGAA